MVPVYVWQKPKLKTRKTLEPLQEFEYLFVNYLSNKNKMETNSFQIVVDNFAFALFMKLDVQKVIGSENTNNNKNLSALFKKIWELFKL